MTQTEQFALTPPEPSVEQIPVLGHQIYGIRTSLSMGKIAMALAKAQLEFDKVRKDTVNPFFKSKYADLATVIDATRKPLADNGIAVVQSPQLDHIEKLIVVTTMLIHSSGEWIAGDLALPFPAGKYDPQAAGSAITYARRYSRQAFVDVAAEMDDDANASTEAVRAAEREQHEKRLAPKLAEQEVIAQFQRIAFVEACKKSGKTEAQVSEFLAKLNSYTAIEEIKKQDFNEAIKWAAAPISNPPDLTAKLKESVSQVKFKKLFALAGKKSLPEDDLKRYAYEAFKISSLHDMNELQFEQLLAWVEGLE